MASVIAIIVLAGLQIYVGYACGYNDGKRTEQTKANQYDFGYCFQEPPVPMEHDHGE